MKILIVDDDPDVRAVLRMIVEQQGHEVIEAGDGQDGFVKAVKHKPDAIISDALMPKMDGFQLLRAVRRDEILGTVPFVIYSAIYTEDKERELAFSLGADGLIVKPKYPDEFWKEFSAALDSRTSKQRQIFQARTMQQEEEELRDYCQMVASKLETKVQELETTIAENRRTKKTAQENEEQYRMLFESNPHPMWVYDLDTLAFLAVNNAAVQKYGYSLKELFSMTIKDIRPVEDVPALVDKVSRRIEGFDEAGTWRHRKKDGTIIDVEITSHSLDFAGRSAVLILAIDVTERRRMEKAIRDASDEWRTTFDTMNDAITLLDSDGNILRCNKAMADLVGKNYQEIIGRKCWELVRGASGSVIDCPYEIMKRSRKRETLVSRLGDRWFDVSVNPLFDSEGNLLGAVQIMSDITERKHMEDALRASFLRAEDEKARADSIIAAIGDGITIQDRDFRIVYQNEANKKIIGDHLGELCYMAYERNEQRCEGCAVARVFEDGGTHVVERSAPTDKGTMYVEITASPLRDSTGNIVAGIEVVHDITKRKQSEEAIRESEIRYRSLFDNMLEGFAYCRMLFDDNRPHNFVYLHVNSAFEKLTGLKNVVGKKVTEVLPGLREAHPELLEIYGRVALTGNAESFDIYLDPLKVWLSIAVYSTQKGYFVAVFDDITERKRLAEMNEERIRIAEFGVDIGIILNTGESEQSILRSCTDAMVKHLDAAFARIWTLDETKTVLELQASSGMYTHIDGPHSRLPIAKKAKIPLIAFTLQPNLTNNVVGDPSVTEQEWAKKEGMVSFAGYPLIVEDRLLGVIGMFAKRPLSEFVLKALEVVAGNIALGIERKHSENKLAKYSNELTSLNMASDTLMIITNLKDIYQEICNIIYSVFDLKMAWLGLIEEGSFDVNAVAYSGSEHGYLSNVKMTWDDSPTGTGPTGMAIKTHTTVISDINDPSFASWRPEAQKRGYVASLAVPLIYARDKCIGTLNFHSDGINYFTPDRVKLCQIFANQAAIAIENARLIEGLEEKVTERTRQIEDTNSELQSVNRELVQRREEAEAGSRSKSDFLANMSHELRTPLNAVIGLSQVLLEQTFGPLNTKQSEYLEGVRQSGDHLLSLINEILDLSKIEAGKEQFEPAVFSILDTLRNAFMFVKEKAMKHGIELSHEIGPEIGLFYGDERRIKQILFNLLSNAVKFTESGGKVGLKAGQDEHALILTVWDTGIGIPEDKRHLIFQPFQQLDGSLSRKHEGTGLGLVLSKRLIEMHGGTLTFESRPGGGTVFTVTLPVHDDKRTGTQTHFHVAQEAPQRTGGLSAGKRIMIVEDNHLNMLLVADFLRGKAFEVVEAATGEIALEKASRERPEIILLDIQMPGIDGFEVLRRLRQDPSFENVPVIAMTALAMKGDKERCLQAGFNDYVSKPVNLDEMLSRIDRNLGRSR